MSNFNRTRRQILSLASVGCIATVAYGYHRGIRFPRLSWEPAELPSSFSSQSVRMDVKDLIQMEHSESHWMLRAFAPEPEITLQTIGNKPITLSVNNIALDAELSVDNKALHNIKEERNGITRTLVIQSANEPIKLEWKLPVLKDYTFAAIGDSGGDQELAWCIQRAHDLGARFFIHLGDFNYQTGDYQRAIDLFHNAPLPCYVTIGNHDFHNSGLIYQPFLQKIGPLNSLFSIGKTRFANLDTAASVYPYHKGQRGKVITQMIANKDEFIDTVAFTHCPLYDPLVSDANPDPHDIGSEGERDWLISVLKRSNSTSLLSGHIHIYSREKFKGIDNIIAGQGLGHQDIMMNQDVSKMAIGQVNQDGKVTYEVAPLAMPMEMHCHPHIDPVKQAMLEFPHADVIREIDKNCKQPS